MLDSRVAVSRRVSSYDRMIGPNGRSLLEKAIELHKMGDLSRAIKTYESVLKESPQHPGAMNLLGLAWFQRGDGARAVPLLQKALALRPDLPGAEFNLGTVLQALGRHEEAVPHFERALALNPDDFGAHASMGNTLIVLGKRSRRLSTMEKSSRCGQTMRSGTSLLEIFRLLQTISTKPLRTTGLR